MSYIPIYTDVTMVHYSLLGKKKKKGKYPQTEGIPKPNEKEIIPFYTTIPNIPHLFEL